MCSCSWVRLCGVSDVCICREELFLIKALRMHLPYCWLGGHAATAVCCKATRRAVFHASRMGRSAHAKQRLPVTASVLVKADQCLSCRGLQCTCDILAAIHRHAISSKDELRLFCNLPHSAGVIMPRADHPFLSQHIHCQHLHIATLTEVSLLQ